jgi:hypothetical protein
MLSKLGDPAPLALADDEAWDRLATRHIKATLKRHDIEYDDLAERLTRMGVPETERSIAIKIDRGAYPAWWLFAVMRALRLRVMLVD